MRVSFNASYEKVKSDNGFGYATKMCKESLSRLGHEVGWQLPGADVELCFCAPFQWQWSCDYRIAYFPWESSEFKPGYVDKFNEVDEVWTPSPVVAQWMKDTGVKRPIYIYEHGVEPLWSTGAKQRTPDGNFEIIHHGAEAIRKGGNDAIKAFMDTLWEDPARLTLKMKLEQFNMIDSDHIRIMNKQVPVEELVSLYHFSDLMLYPSYGEGFGLTPLQALAGGMPVLITRGWAPYEDMLPEEFLIDSVLDNSPWPEHHPGKMFIPSHDDACDKLRWHFDNREKSSQLAWDMMPDVVKRYDWDAQTQAAFARLM